MKIQENFYGGEMTVDRFVDTPERALEIGAEVGATVYWTGRCHCDCGESLAIGFDTDLRIGVCEMCAGEE